MCPLWLTALLISLHALWMPLGWSWPLSFYCWQLQLSCNVSNLSLGLCLTRTLSHSTAGGESPKARENTSDLLHCSNSPVAPWEIPTFSPSSGMCFLREGFDVSRWKNNWKSRTGIQRYLSGRGNAITENKFSSYCDLCQFLLEPIGNLSSNQFIFHWKHWFIKAESCRLEDSFPWGFEGLGVEGRKIYLFLHYLANERLSQRSCTRRMWEGSKLRRQTTVLPCSFKLFVYFTPR